MAACTLADKSLLVLSLTFPSCDLETLLLWSVHFTGTFGDNMVLAEYSVYSFFDSERAANWREISRSVRIFQDPAVS